jgi:indolepyruvate ferredoxin oxidoreductase
MLFFMENPGAIPCFSLNPTSVSCRIIREWGLGGGTGSGIAPFIKNKQVVFLGDSTFFHSGMVAVSDSIKNHQDITYIILENKTTAMTGHQPTPGTAQDVMDQKTFAQDIELLIRGMARDVRSPLPRQSRLSRFLSNLLGRGHPKRRGQSGDRR